MKKVLCFFLCMLILIGALPASTLTAEEERQGLSFSASQKEYAQFSACTIIPETVELWLKVPEGYASHGTIVGGYGYSGKEASEIFWSVEINANGTLRWWEEAAGKEMKYCCFDGSYGTEIRLNTGRWTLVSVVRDQENKRIVVYLNGEYAGESTYIYTTNLLTNGINVFDYTTGKVTTDPPRIGRNWRETQGYSPRTFEGELGELRMYRDDRTAAEIRKNYENDLLLSQKSSAYLTDKDLYGDWQLRALRIDEAHPYRFDNLAAGAGAEADLSIQTVGFAPEGAIGSQGVNKTALHKQIAVAEAIHDTGYSAESRNAFQQALTEAKAANNQSDTTQTAVDTAEQALKAAIEQLHKHLYQTPLRDDTSHWKECACGDKTDLAAHTFTWVVDRPASEALEGIRHEECVCGAIRNENATIEKLTHAYEDGGIICIRCGYNKMRFTDVKEKHWFYDEVAYVYAKGLMNGTGDGTTFEPNTATSRAMLVTILYRLEGSPAVRGGNPFPDVKNQQWYTNAILWAAEQGIVTGYDTGAFGPHDPVTREQMATILYRYAEYKGRNVSARADISAYPDQEQVGGWARNALCWANAEGLITGAKIDGTVLLNPKGNATRAELATVLKRF